MNLLYKFQEGSGTIINDLSGFGTPLNLQIYTPASVEWTDYGFNFTSISCDEEGIIVDFEVIEGSISGLQIIFYDGGNSDYIKRLQSFEKGKHKIGISKEEYTKRLDSPNRVQLAYIFDVGGRAQIAPATQIISCN